MHVVIRILQAICDVWVDRAQMFDGIYRYA